MAGRRVGSIKNELIKKSREAALNAIQTYNNPHAQFRSETYIVLMTIAWTYLMHAYYRGEGVDYRYFDQLSKRKRYHRTKHGEYKHWELERCLNEDSCPLDRATQLNLRFLIGLRHEIEHQMSQKLDDYLSGRYQACALNYCRYLKSLFGESWSIDDHLAYTIQFSQILYHQIDGSDDEDDLPRNVKAYIVEFDDELTEDEYNNQHYSYRLLFTRKFANRKGQADRVVEFLDPESEEAEEMERQYWIIKEREKAKFRPGQIVDMMKNEGYPKFGMHQHTELWQSLDTKDESKGFGTLVSGELWRWYENWIDVVRQHCADNRDKYA